VSVLILKTAARVRQFVTEYTHVQVTWQVKYPKIERKDHNRLRTANFTLCWKCPPSWRNREEQHSDFQLIPRIVADGDVQLLVPCTSCRVRLDKLYQVYCAFRVTPAFAQISSLLPNPLTISLCIGKAPWLKCG
jgi:hypothetical protein